jgi:Outer membrane protein beta-barrel domain
MLRRIAAVLLGSALLFMPLAPANAQVGISVSGGVAVPISDLGDVTDMGYNVAAGLNFGGTHLPVGLRIEGALNGFGITNFDGDARIFDATANAVVNFSQKADSPYLIGGLGIYNTKFSDLDDSDNGVGLNIGGGLRFPLSGISTFFEARYHVILGDGNHGRQFIPVTFGVVF